MPFQHPNRLRILCLATKAGIAIQSVFRLTPHRLQNRASGAIRTLSKRLANSTRISRQSRQYSLVLVLLVLISTLAGVAALATSAGAGEGLKLWMLTQSYSPSITVRSFPGSELGAAPSVARSPR